MKKLLLALIIALSIPMSCFAHWLPQSEMYVGGVGINCTLGYVKSVYGQPAEKKWFNFDGIRGVTYIYSPTFSITGRTGNMDRRAEDELLVVGFNLKEGSLATPSGITVGMPIETVFGMYGRVPKTTSHDGRHEYIYSVGFREMAFYVNGSENITEIRVGTDW